MRATGTIIDSWLDGIRDGIPHVENGRRLAAVAVSVDGRTRGNRSILTGGTWRRETNGTSDLAEYLPAGRRRSQPVLLITGDEWQAPPFHSSVQWLVRSALQGRARALGADTLLVPFSALAAAGIDRTSIRPLEIRPDRNVETLEPIPDELRLDELGTAHSQGRPYETYGATGRRYSWRLGDGRTLCRDETLETWRHVYDVDKGESVRTVETLEPGASVSAPSVYRSGRPLWNQSVRLDESTGAYVIVHSRHFLGDSLFTAETVSRRRRRREWTVRDVVASAVDCCRRERQDRFTDSGRARDRFELDAANPPFEPASARLAAVDINEPIAELVPVRVRRRYLSSFDANEPRALYFLATLPSSSRARTVDMAIDDLAPAPVHAAMARGRDVLRQGDIFAIETSLQDSDVATWPRARLTLFTGHGGFGVDPKRGEPGYVAPLSRDERERLVARARFNWRIRFRALDVPGPVTSPGARGRFRALREDWLEDVARDKGRARAAVLKGDGRTAENYRRYARGKLARGPADSNGYRSRAHSRDGYRLAGRLVDERGRARALYAECLRDELVRLRPALSAGAVAIAARDVARILSVHGTAHSASQVARGPGGAVYMKGIMRHVPELERGRGGQRDHVNLRLGDGRAWYLAVRNTVPRNRDTNG